MVNDEQNNNLKADWTKDIPENWKTFRLKNIASLRFSNVDKITNEGEIDVRLCNYLDVYNNDYITSDIEFMKATASVDEIKKFKLDKEDVLVTKDSETANDIAVPAFVQYECSDLICGYHLAQIKPYQNILRGEYLFRLFQSKPINAHFEINATGVTRYGLSIDSFSTVLLPLPPIAEQERIIRHIGIQSEKINRFIKKKQRFIELLKEQRQSIVNGFITKGGDNWLWLRLKNIATINDEALSEKTDNEYLMKYIDIGNVNSFGDIAELQEYTFENAPSRARRIVRKGDVIISTVRTYLKAITLIESDEDNLIASTGFAILRPKSNISSEYLNLALRAEYFITSIIRHSYGVSYPAINSTTLSALKIQIPKSVQEQKEILKKIKTETATIDATISKTERELELIREYKVSMIAEAVMGKLNGH